MIVAAVSAVLSTEFGAYSSMRRETFGFFNSVEPPASATFLFAVLYPAAMYAGPADMPFATLRANASCRALSSGRLLTHFIVFAALSAVAATSPRVPHPGNLARLWPRLHPRRLDLVASRRGSLGGVTPRHFHHLEP